MSPERMAAESALTHFGKRAQKYNHSSHWIDDEILIAKIRDLAQASKEESVLDIATGTGKIAEAFLGRVKSVVGVDISCDMALQAKECADRIVLASAECLPFENNSFDTCVCRQGLQFMKLDDALAEIYRVLKPGGRVVLCHLTAYGKEDAEETFLIQRLRNPARKNFFLPDDIPTALGKNIFEDITSFEYITREPVNQWVDNGAISETSKEEIRQAYLNASDGFGRIHRISFENGDLLDFMKMVIVCARKKEI